jgi:outer membrane lipoprotein-sorting protein
MKNRLALVCLALAFLGSCRVAGPPAPPPEASVREIIARLHSRQEGVTSFAGRGRLTLLSPERNATGSASLKGRFPDALRVEVYDLLGRSLFSLATDHGRMELLFPREGKYFQGPASPANLAAFIPPGVTLPQALRLLTGDLPLSPGDPARMRYEAETRLYVLEWLNPDGGVRERLWVEPQTYAPRREEWYGEGGVLLFQAELGDYAGPPPGRPRQIKVLTPANQGELRLTYKEFSLNPPLAAGDLTLSAPPGVTALPLKP